MVQRRSILQSLSNTLRMEGVYVEIMFQFRCMVRGPVFDATMLWRHLIIVMDQREGGRVRTVDVCCLCYRDTEFVSQEVARVKEKFVVKNPLPVCTGCIARNIKLPVGGTYFSKKRADPMAGKVALERNTVAISRTASSRKKGRRSH